MDSSHDSTTPEAVCSPAGGVGTPRVGKDHVDPTPGTTCGSTEGMGNNTDEALFKWLREGGKIPSTKNQDTQAKPKGGIAMWQEEQKKNQAEARVQGTQNTQEFFSAHASTVEVTTVAENSDEYSQSVEITSVASQVTMPPPELGDRTNGDFFFCTHSWDGGHPPGWQHGG